MAKLPFTWTARIDMFGQDVERRDSTVHERVKCNSKNAGETTRDRKTCGTSVTRPTDELVASASYGGVAAGSIVHLCMNKVGRAATYLPLPAADAPYMRAALTKQHKARKCASPISTSAQCDYLACQILPNIRTDMPRKPAPLSVAFSY